MTWWAAGLARLGIRTPAGRDTAVAVVLAAAGLSRLVLVLTGTGGIGGPVPAPSLGALAAAHLLATADLAAIAVRRRHPRAVLMIATVVPLLSGLLPARPPWIGLGTVVCAYTVATLLPRRTAAVTIGAGMAVHAAGGVLVVLGAGGDVGGLLTFWGVPRGDLVQMTVAAAMAYALPALAGSYVRTRRAYFAELAARMAWLEREREERARAAVVAERMRIARELHDVAAHDLSAIVVQAGAADRLLDQDPAAARATLKAIRAQGRDTLAALRTLVGIMRAATPDGRPEGLSGGSPDGSPDAPPDGLADELPDDRADDVAGGFADGAATVAPRPSLARLAELAGRARETGMRVEVLRHGGTGPLPLTVDLAAYRVIQEALTNARRHAPGAPVTVTTRLDEGGLRITVHNTAPPDGAPGGGTSGRTGGGHGLAGMRERVQYAGGALRAGPAGDGGWRVEARFPVTEPEGR